MKSSSSSSKASRLCIIGNGGPENAKELLNMKCEEIMLSVLPKETPYSRYELCQYQGFWFPLNFLEGILPVREIFKPQPSDIFVCTSPKTGTTWLKALTFSIMTRDRFDHDDSTNPLLTKLPHDCVPTLETDYAKNPTFLDTELPLLATHIPYSLLPTSILESDCKIIYICREPKDTLVSMWHFYQRVIECIDELRANPTTFEQLVKAFCEGKSIYGPYWDHVSEYWKASVDRPHRVFFLKYEDLKNDTLGYVKKLAEFMGNPFSKEEEKQGVAEKIVALCNFQSLSNINKTQETGANNNSMFFRKGEIGDWKNHLSEDMAKSIDHITQQKFQCLGLTFPISAQREDTSTKE